MLAVCTASVWPQGAVAVPGASAVSATSATSGTAAVEAIDDRGVRVRLARPPRRIVSLLPSLTELVCELGACGRLVGVDSYSNWPASVQSLPHLGGLDDAQIEAIVALKPDLVLLAGSTRAAARLQALGLNVAALEPRTLADVRRVAGQVALLLGPGVAAGDAAEALLRRIEQGLQKVASRVPAGLRGTSVYFEVSAAPYAAGESSFIGELLTRLGLVNVVPASLGPFPLLNLEFVVRADPQLIMLADRSGTALRLRPGWERIRAVREGRVCQFTPEEGDVLVRPGPRMAEAAGLMLRCLQRQPQ